MQLEKITNDLFDICNRLVSVNPNYQLFFNKKTCKYEVHDFTQRDNSLAFVVPYEKLDARTVFFAQKTAKQNAEKLFAEIEQYNAKLEKEQVSNGVNKVLQLMEEGEKYET